MSHHSGNHGVLQRPEVAEVDDQTHPDRVDGEPAGRAQVEQRRGRVELEEIGATVAACSHENQPKDAPTAPPNA